MYDRNADQYAHPSGIMITTPEGKVSRYMYGIEYTPRDLKFSLIDASNNTIGSPVDKILLLCYHYDPMTGKYGVVIMNVLRGGFILIVLLLAISWVIMYLKDRRAKQSLPGLDVKQLKKIG